MSVPSFHQYRTMGSYVNVYTFTKAGDVLPIHTHPVDHTAIVARGRVKVLSNHGSVEVGPGHIVTLNTPHEHGFEALDDETILLNVFKDPEDK